jgi:hypothetical protein
MMRQAVSKWIEKAQFGGHCRKCGAEIKAGERILWSRTRGALCTACGEALKAEESQARRAALDALGNGRVSAREVYEGSDGALTRKFLSELRGRGDAGRIAALLFAAQKSSHRAKRYGATPYRDMAYDRKGKCLSDLCVALSEYGPGLGFRFGWGRDESSCNPWVLYVELPGGVIGEKLQVSFHSPERYSGPDYQDEWDGKRMSEDRIIKFCQTVFAATEK